MSDAAQGPGWWQASDGRWYPPEQHPSYRSQPPPAPAPAPAAKPAPLQEAPQKPANRNERRYEYDAEVNKKSVNALPGRATELNTRAKKGWRLHTAFEQDGNTITIYEREI